MPSLHRAIELFGVKPLIVRLFAPEEESTPICWQYPEELYPFARDPLNGNKAKQDGLTQSPQRAQRTIK